MIKVTMDEKFKKGTQVWIAKFEGFQVYKVSAVFTVGCFFIHILEKLN